MFTAPHSTAHFPCVYFSSAKIRGYLDETEKHKISQQRLRVTCIEVVNGSSTTRVSDLTFGLGSSEFLFEQL